VKLTSRSLLGSRFLF